jgi:hypothetical protein
MEDKSSVCWLLEVAIEPNLLHELEAVAGDPAIRLMNHIEVHSALWEQGLLSPPVLPPKVAVSVTFSLKSRELSYTVTKSK